MKMCRYRFGFVRLMAVVAAVLMAMPSCSLIYEWPEEEETKLGVSASLRITLSVPSTKALAGDADSPYDNPYQHEGSDNMLVLNDLDFVFYDTDGNFVTSATGSEKVILGDVEYSAPYHKYAAEILVDGVQDGATYRIVVLANRRRMYSGYLPFAVPSAPVYTKPLGYTGTDEQYLYSQLEFNSGAGDASLTKYTQMNLGAYEQAGVPMWGVLKTKLKVRADKNRAELESSGEIYLLRSIAKVKVSLGDDLLRYVKITDYVAGDAGTGVVMHYSRNKSYMPVSYSWAGGVDTTPSTVGKDKVDGVYSNANLNIDNNEVLGNYEVPMFKDVDGSYYMYLSEQKIGEAYMTLQFQYTDNKLPDPLKELKTLHFADYTAAAAGKPDIPLTEDELAPFKFPVMRNHYYVYTVTKLDPFELKFEVCPWEYRTADDIDFGYVPSQIEDILGFSGYAFRYTHSGSEVRFWVKGSVSNSEATITAVYVDGNPATLNSGEYATGLCYWKSKSIEVRYTVRFRGVDYVIVRKETIS